MSNNCDGGRWFGDKSGIAAEDEHVRARVRGRREPDSDGQDLYISVDGKISDSGPCT